jgi:hypothetical protein
LVLSWIAFNLLSLVVSLPTYYEQRRRLGPGEVSGAVFHGWTTPQIHAAAAELGLSGDIIAASLFAASLVSLSCFLGVAGLLLWRKGDTWVGLLGAYVLFSIGPGFSGLLLNQSRLAPLVQPLYVLSPALTWPTFFLMLYLFPTGKFVPRFSRHLALLPYLVFLVAVVVPLGPQLEATLQWVVIAYLLGGLASQVYRYRRVSGLAEREQTKWVVVALGVVCLLLVIDIAPVIFPALAIGSPRRFLFDFLSGGILSVLVPALIPLAIGVAILRYRLWDIDVIIRRTLVYSVLSAVLALAYFGSVLLLESVFRAMTGQGQSGLVVVLSTLAIAALFGPVRWRVQTVIDRRFFRRKYDAARTLAEFGAQARDTVDLDDLTKRLVAVADKALQPTSVGLWLRSAARTDQWDRPV